MSPSSFFAHLRVCTAMQMLVVIMYLAKAGNARTFMEIFVPFGKSRFKAKSWKSSILFLWLHELVLKREIHIKHNSKHYLKPKSVVSNQRQFTDNVIVGLFSETELKLPVGVPDERHLL